MSAAWSVLPPLIKVYGQAYPDAEIQLSEVLPRELNASLMSGNADIGIAFPWQRPAGLEYLCIHREPLCAVLPSGHQLATNREIDVAALACEPFITFVITSYSIHYTKLYDPDRYAAQTRDPGNNRPPIRAVQAQSWQEK